MKHLIIIICLTVLPGTEWNCKCDIAETDEPATDNSDVPNIEPPRGLEGNPAETGEVFTDKVGYIRNAGKNRKERDRTEMECEQLGKLQTSNIAKNTLTGKKGECFVSGKMYEVEFIERGIDHYTRDIFGNKNIFWLKNEILPRINDFLKSAQCVGRKVSDTSHNTNAKTVRLKRQTDYFYYFQIRLPNGEEAYLHLGRYNSMKKGKEGTMYLYTITKKAPKEMEEM